MLRRVNALIEDMRRNGHEGIGTPEQLRGNWSGRCELVGSRERDPTSAVRRV
jgi:Txe/YoeB family toxin of Txe-Axe toxin-antitoxin module